MTRLGRISRGLFGALVAAQLAYPRVPRRHHRAATRGIVVLMLATSAAEAVAARGRRGGALVGAAGALGLAAEVVGTRSGKPFGHYTYGPALGPKVAGVPVLAAAAWALLARPAWVTAGWLDRRPARRVALAAGALTAWDVFLDPRMAADGYWDWPDGGVYEGVPLSNFAGWLVTGTAVFAAWQAVDRDPPRAGRDDWALTLYAWTWVGETVANAVFWRRPRVALAGGLAMGAFAAPALRRRLAS